MTTFVDVFALRVPYLLGNEYVAGFLATNSTYVKGIEFRNSAYTRGLKQCVALVCACKDLYRAREHIGYHRPSTLCRLEGFRNLDCYIEQGGGSFDPPSTKLHALEIVVNEPNCRPISRTRISLKEFPSLRRVVIFKPKGTFYLSDIVDACTWPERVDELELHATKDCNRFYFSGPKVPVKRLTISTGDVRDFYVDASALKSWGLLCELTIESSHFSAIESLVEDIASFPQLRTLKIETTPEWVENEARDFRADWRNSSSLEKVVVHFVLKGKSKHRRNARLCSAPGRKKNLANIMLPFGFSDWHQTADIPFKGRQDFALYEPGCCWQTVKDHDMTMVL